jgi:hypothetical protein
LCNVFLASYEVAFQVIYRIRVQLSWPAPVACRRASRRLGDDLHYVPHVSLVGVPAVGLTWRRHPLCLAVYFHYPVS